MKATLTVLGSGTSMGVPTIGCDCRVCTSTDPHDYRTRPSIMLEYDGRCVLIDTTPDFRQQAIREKITRIDAVLYTHAHADHILGLDDVRPLSFRSPEKIPLYADDSTAQALEQIFRYIFDPTYKFGGIARVSMNRMTGSVNQFGVDFEPAKVIHGEAEIHGFRFGSAAYLTDFSDIPEASLARLRGLDILFLDALRHKPHPTHYTVAISLLLVNELKPQRAFFTHISHDLPHQETNKTLPDKVRLAHDGLKLEFDIA
jgi:phosphoribosyl 1,2-cyclic phosphate phosphodiesterase